MQMVEKGNGYKVGERNFETISDAIDYYQVGLASLLQTGKPLLARSARRSCPSLASRSFWVRGVL